MPEGDLFKLAGIDMALRAEPSEWRGQYLVLSERYFESLRFGDVFIGEDMRLWMQEQGLPQPHHPNVWGGMARTVLLDWLDRDRIIVAGGRNGKDPRAHSQYFRAYRKL